MRAPIRISLACLAFLAGCGSTPVQVIESGPRHEFASSLASRQAANCVARNGQNINSQYTATLADLPAADQFEVVVSAPQTSAGAIVVAHTSAAANGSRITFIMSPRMSESAAPEWIEKLRKGC